MKKNEIGLILIYFGKFPEYSKLFFKSLEYCQNVDLLLFTDQSVDEYQYQNLKVYSTQLAELREKFQKHYDFPIILDAPYKICDFRPAFGELFAEELKQYRFWGHCDMDMIFGNVAKFLPNTVLDNNCKIYQHGHLTLYRNDDEINSLYRREGGKDYRDVFSTPIACIYDEVEGIQKKLDMLNIQTYKKRDCADISPWHYDFRRAESNLDIEELDRFNYDKQLFFWQNGEIYRAYYSDGTICIDEFNYLHFQKRNLSINFENVDNVQAFYITREGFFAKDSKKNPCVEDIERYNSKSYIGEAKIRVKYIWFVWKRRFRKYILKK